MKVLVGLSLTAATLIGVFAFSESQQNKLLSQQINDYERQNSQLLTQIENNSLRNIEADKALSALQSELNNRDNQLASLSRELDTAEQNIDPDYQKIESRIRQQLTREIQANNDASMLDPRIATLNQLNELDPEVLGEILSLNAQFGGFLRELNVSDERKEVVINALHNLIVEQNQARSEIILGLQNDPQAGNRGELRRQMREISEPSAQQEALAYDLTESELDAFARYQEQMQNSSVTFRGVGGISGTSTGPVGGPIIFSSGAIQGGRGGSRAVQILPALPDN